MCFKKYLLAHEYSKLRSDGIIESCPNENFKGKFIIIEAKEFVGAMKELCEDGAKPLLAHMGDHEITWEARKYLMEKIYVSVSALVGSTFIARMMANLLMNFVKPTIPMKMFADSEAAVQWIKNKREELHKKEEPIIVIIQSEIAG